MDRERIQDYKDLIIKDLEFNITPTYHKCGLTKDEFLEVLTLLKDEGKITFDIIKTILPNGEPSPFYGEPDYIRLVK